MASINPFNIVKQQIDKCADILKLDPGTHAILRSPKREIHVSLPVRMDSGKIKVFQGWRILYNDARGPGKGGLRFYPGETVDTVRALAAWMTWKGSLLDLPLGGAKGGIDCNAKDMSVGEIERLSREYVRAVFDFIGPTKDIPAPDVYSTPQIMAWMMDEYSKIARSPQFGVITGKPLCVGGSIGRNDATARGGMFTIREAARLLGINLNKATVAIQGYGNAGAFAHSLCKEMFGCKIVAVSDSKGGIMNEAGLDPNKVAQHKAKTGSVVNLTGAKTISNEEVLELGVDILIPAALENTITDKNASNIKAKILAELANGPTTPEADDILYKNGVHVIPDFLCNAGGVTVSYFEMVQNFYMYSWEETEVRERLDKKMTTAYLATVNTSKQYKVNMRQAAYILAVGRVAEAMKIRGWV
ncbi:Glu/Leu/Phe/Val dehydrogenase [Chloroflexota bacterium]